MKRLLFLPLLLVPVALLGTALLPADGPAPDTRPAPLRKAVGPIKIDGVLDEPAWKDAVPVDVVYVWGAVGKKSAEPRMHVRYTWDDDYLYLGYETFDRNLVALGTGELQGPKGN